MLWGKNLAARLSNVIALKSEDKTTTKNRRICCRQSRQLNLVFV